MFKRAKRDQTFFETPICAIAGILEIGGIMIDSPSYTSISIRGMAPRECDLHKNSRPLKCTYGLAIFSGALHHRFPTAVNVGEPYRSFVKSKRPTNKLPVINRTAIIERSDEQDSIPEFWSDDLKWEFASQHNTTEAAFTKRDSNCASFLIFVSRNE